MKRKPGPYPRRGILEKHRKTPYCSKCGKQLTGTVPMEATNIVCFVCDNPPKPKKTAGLQHLYSKRSTAKAKSIVTLPSLPWKD